MEGVGPEREEREVVVAAAEDEVVVATVVVGMEVSLEVGVVDWGHRLVQLEGTMEMASGAEVWRVVVVPVVEEMGVVVLGQAVRVVVPAAQGGVEATLEVPVGTLAWMQVARAAPKAVAAKVPAGRAMRSAVAAGLEAAEVEVEVTVEVA